MPFPALEYTFVNYSIDLNQGCYRGVRVFRGGGGRSTLFGLQGAKKPIFGAEGAEKVKIRVFRSAEGAAKFF